MSIPSKWMAGGLSLLTIEEVFSPLSICIFLSFPIPSYYSYQCNFAVLDHFWISLELHKHKWLNWREISKNVSTFMSSYYEVRLNILLQIRSSHGDVLDSLPWFRYSSYEFVLHVTVVLFCSLQVYGIQYTVFTCLHKAQVFPFLLLTLYSVLLNQTSRLTII